MFFRLSNSPATFQRFMNDSFKDMITEGWLIVYMDDMLITASDKWTNTEQTKRVLQRMKELNLHLKLKKFKFGFTKVDFLGTLRCSAATLVGDACSMAHKLQYQ